MNTNIIINKVENGKGKRVFPIFLSVLILFSIVILSFGSCNTEADEYHIDLFLSGKFVRSITLYDLMELEQIDFAGNENEKGPTLLSVLNLVDIYDFSQVVVYGLSEEKAEKSRILTETEIALTSSQVFGVLMVITENETVKLAIPNTLSHDWIFDVYKIEVSLPDLGSIG